MGWDERPAGVNLANALKQFLSPHIFADTISNRHAFT